MKKRKQLTYTQFDKTVSVGQKLKVRWANDKEEIVEVADFSLVSNSPITTAGRIVYLDYVVDWDYHEKDNTEV